MTIFVTGGTSSIGRVLLKEYSQKGEQLKVLVRKNSNRLGLDLPGVSFVFGDVTDPHSVKEGMRGCSQVVHMAAVVGNNLPEEEWWLVNREGTRNVLQAAFEHGIQSMVQVSSMSVLGDTQPGEIADETRLIDPQKHHNLYEKTKFAADEIARDFVSKGLPVKIVYPGFGFGCSFATSHPSLQDQTLLRMASKKPTAIMGTGKNKLCVSYYKDTSEGIYLALDHGKTGEGYILGNENVTFVEIWQAVAATLGKKSPKIFIPLSVLRTVSGLSEKLRHKRIFPQDFFDMVSLNWCFSNKKAKDELGWKPLTFLEGIEETWMDYQKVGWKSD